MKPLSSKQGLQENQVCDFEEAAAKTFSQRRSRSSTPGYTAEGFDEENGSRAA